MTSVPHARVPNAILQTPVILIRQGSGIHTERTSPLTADRNQRILNALN